MFDENSLYSFDSAVLNRGGCLSPPASAMFVFGMIIAMLGTLFGLPEMRERLGINLAQQGELFSILSFGMLRVDSRRRPDARPVRQQGRF